MSRTEVLPKMRGQITGDNEAPKLFDERRTHERKTANMEVRIKTPPFADEHWTSRIAEVNACGIFETEGDFPDP